MNRQRSVCLAGRPLEIFLSRVREELGLGEAEVTVCLVSDAEIARMNETFRKKKGATDVLSFPARKRRSPVKLRRNSRATAADEYLGDIAISPATAGRHAKKRERLLLTELRILILHGMLHLLGYDHETDRGQMERIEMKLRKRLGLA